MKLNATGMFAGIAVLAGISQASAAIVTVTYEGTVAEANEGGSALFGGVNLIGMSWVAKYVFDTTQGNTSSGPTSNSANESFSPFASPLLSNTVTIAGTINGIPFLQSQSIIPSNGGKIYGYNDGSFSQQYHTAVYGAQAFFGGIQPYTYHINNELQNTVSQAGAGLPATIDAPFVYNVTNGDTATGFISFYSYSLYDFNNQKVVDYDAYVRADIFRLTETVEGIATPLPAALPLFATGLGMLGFAAWRRKRPRWLENSSQTPDSGGAASL